MAAEAPDKSALDDVLNPNQAKGEAPQTVASSDCVNCANQGKTNKLDPIKDDSGNVTLTCKNCGYQRGTGLYG